MYVHLLQLDPIISVIIRMNGFLSHLNLSCTSSNPNKETLEWFAWFNWMSHGDCSVYCSYSEAKVSTRIPEVVCRHQVWRRSDDIGNSVHANRNLLKTSKLPRPISTLLFVGLFIQEFLFNICHLSSCWDSTWHSKTNPESRVLLKLVEVRFKLQRNQGNRAEMRVPVR